TIRELLMTADAPPPDQALIIVSGVLEALAYSHQHGIVHRDIKPANVIITRGGAVKVMDFGIARALHGASNTMTQTGMVMGTPQYLSPEQALGKAVDARSDLYATGCLLYELLTRRPPFTGETPLSVVYQHVQDDPVLPSQVSDAVPPELDGLVMRALAKEPDDRFQTAEEMRGLTQYALQMLHEQGGHTGGLWNTGPTEHYGAATQALGVPDAGARPHPSHSDTSQLGAPLLAGARDDDGGFEGGPRRGGGRGGGSKAFTYALVAFLAVIAIAGGVFFALGGEGKDQDNQKKPDKSTSAPKDHKKPSKKPDPTPTETEEDQPGIDGGSGEWPTSPPPRTAPSQTQSSQTGPPQTGGDPSHTGNGGNNGGDTEGGDGGKPTDEVTPPSGGGDQNGGNGGKPGGGGGSPDGGSGDSEE
ncbi:serine/threonine protein kinase, partial [Streptomyces albus subsp. chlorinus]